MDARAWSAGAAALLLAVGGLTFLQFQDDGAEIAAEPSVRLYQGGYAWVERTLPVGVPGTLTFDVPEGTLLGTVRVSGENVTLGSARGPAGALPQPSPGERVRVVTTGGEFEGTLVSAEQHPYLTLATDEGTVHVNPQEVVAVVEAGAEEAPEGGATVSVEVAGPGGDQEVRVGYLVRGPGWEAAYHVDPDSGETVVFALVTNPPEISGATVDLAVGTPRVARGAPGPFMAMEAAAAGGRAADGVAPAVEGELHLLRLNRTVDLAPGGTLRIPVWEGALSIVEREYRVEAIAGIGEDPAENFPISSEERITFLNDLGIPLPPGTAHFYREGNWTASENVPYTPMDGNVTLTVGPARDVRAERVVAEAEARAEATNVTERITVKNFKDEPAEVRVVVRVPTDRFTVTDVTPPPEERTGERIAWALTVPPGESETVALTYERFTGRPGIPEPVSPGIERSVAKPLPGPSG